LKVKFLFFIFIASIIVISLTQAQIPKLINYQGKLTDANSLPVNGTRSITFSIYESASGGSALWSETHTSATVTNGIFSILLGSVTDLGNLEFDKPYYLGITIGSGTEMTPRKQIVSTAYAMRAENANHAQSADSLNGKSADEILKNISSVTSGCLWILACEFSSVNPNQDYNLERYTLFGENPGEEMVFNTQIHLPNGSVIREFHAYIYDNDSNEDIQCMLIMNLDILDLDPPVPCAVLDSDGTPGKTELSKTDILRTFSAQHQSLIRIDWRVPSSPHNIQFMGARIIYTMNSN